MEASYFTPLVEWVFWFFNLPPTKEEVNAIAGVCLSVCLSVSKITKKMHGWIWTKCCMSTDVGTWTNWLTFEPDLVYSQDAGTRLLSLISYALQRGILLRRENFTYRYWVLVPAARHGFKIQMVLFTASRGNTFVGLSEVHALYRVPF